MPEDLPYGQRGTGRLLHSAALRAANLQPFISSLSLTNSLRSNTSKRCRSRGRRFARPRHQPCQSAPVGQDCGRPPLTLRRPQTCCPTSALPRMLSHPAAPPARRWHPPEPTAPADCPLPPAADKRLAPLIVLHRVVMVFLRMLDVEVIIDIPDNTNRIRAMSVIVLLLCHTSRHIRCCVSVLLYVISVNIRLFMIPGFAENLP